MTSAVVLNEGSHVPLAAACYPVAISCVPAEGHGGSCNCCVSSHCVTASDDLKYNVDFVA
jgi:hypothetical protein